MKLQGPNFILKNVPKGQFGQRTRGHVSAFTASSSSKKIVEEDNRPACCFQLLSLSLSLSLSDFEILISL